MNVLTIVWRVVGVLLILWALSGIISSSLFVSSAVGGPAIAGLVISVLALLGGAYILYRYRK